MNTEGAQGVLGGFNRSDFFFHANVPKLDLSISATTDEFPHASSLHVHIGDPLLVTTPSLLHSRGRSLTLIEDSECSVTVAGYKDVSCNLVGGQRGNARTRACGNFLQAR